MKKNLFLVVFITGCIFGMQAEDFRMGIIGSAEFFEKPSCGEFFDVFDDEAVVFPGFYWEVMPHRLGFGMTYHVKFTSEQPDQEKPDRLWFLDWIVSWDWRYHFFKKFFLDPFVEFGIGCAGEVFLSPYDLYEENEIETNLLSLSLFVQLGGGVALRLDGFHIGLKLMYRLLNEPVPVTEFGLYPLMNFQGSVFAGFTF